MTDSYLLTREFSFQSVTLLRTSGLLSLVGSLILLYVVFSDRHNKLQRIHYRLLVGTCLTDVVYSIAICVATAAIPRDTPDLYHIVGNIGTTASCQAQGFFIQWGGLGVPFYMASLSLYFLLVIRYKMKEEDISKRIEPMMHCVSTIIPIGFAIAGLALNLYHNKLAVCWIEAEPWGCTTIMGYECTQAKNAPFYELFFVGIWVFLIILFEILTMVLIYYAVKKQERTMNTFDFRSRATGRVLSPCSVKSNSKTKDTAIQAFLYIFAFLLTYTFPIFSYLSFRDGTSPNKICSLVASFCSPLLGFWNFIAYIRPRYVRVSRDHPDQSFLWKFKTTLLVSNVKRSPVQREMAVPRNVRRISTSLPTDQNGPPLNPPNGNSNVSVSLVALGTMDDR